MKSPFSQNDLLAVCNVFTNEFNNLCINTKFQNCLKNTLQNNKEKKIQTPADPWPPINFLSSELYNIQYAITVQFQNNQIQINTHLKNNLGLRKFSGNLITYIIVYK